MTESTYTLADYLRQAGVKDEIAFAKFIPIDLRDGEGNLCKPRPDQIVALNKGLKVNRFGLFDDPGCGKTVISQAYSLFYVGLGAKVVVVMPPILLFQFDESFRETFIGVEKYVNIHIHGSHLSPKKRKALEEGWDENDSWPEIICMSYQMFYKYYSTLMEKGYDVLVADEAHALKNPESNIYKRVVKFLRDWEDTAFLPMTGTPIENELIDAYGLLDLINPGCYSSKKQFTRRHCVHTWVEYREPKVLPSGKKLTGFNKLVGYKNKKELQRNLYKNARRVTKDQVMELKEPTVINFPIRLDAKHQALYNKLAKEKILELDNGEVITALQEQRLRQAMLQIITDPLEFMSEGSKIKNNVLEACDQLMETVNVEKTKIILFANYKASCRALAKHYEQYNPAILNGEVANPEKEKQKFLKDDTCRVLIANPQSAGVGLNLQKVCHNAVFVEPCPVPGRFKQACERIFRGGQINTVNIWILKVLGTVSPKQIENMVRKEGQIQSINRDPQSLLDEFLGAA